MVRLHKHKVMGKRRRESVSSIVLPVIDIVEAVMSEMGKTHTDGEMETNASEVEEVDDVSIGSIGNGIYTNLERYSEEVRFE